MTFIFLVVLILFVLQLPFSITHVPLLARISRSVLSSWFVAGLSAIVLVIWLTRPDKYYSLTIIDLAIGIYISFLLLHHFTIVKTLVDPVFLSETLVTILVFLFFRFTSNKYLILILCVVAFSSLIQAVVGILQYGNALPFHSESTGITGSFYNSGPFAGYLLLSIPTGLAVYLTNQRKKLSEPRWLTPGIKIIALTIYLTVVCIAIVLSKSRAAWLGVSIFLIFFIAIIYKTKAKLLWTNFHGIVKLFTISILIGSVVSFGCLVYDYKKDSAQGRILIWRNTIRMIADHPLSGVGLNQFQAHYMNYQAEFFQKNPESAAIRLADNTIYPFNTFLKLIAEQGILAVFPVCLIFYSVFFSKTIQPPRMNPLIVTIRTGLIGLIVFSLFSYPEAILPIGIHACLFVTILAGHQIPVLRKITVPHCRAINHWIRKVVILVLAIPVFGFLTGKLIDLSRGSCQWDLALKTFKPAKALVLMKDAYPALKNNGIFCSVYGSMLEKANRPLYALEVLEKAEILMPTTNVLISQAECYLQTHDYARAEQRLRIAQNMIPTRIKPTYLLIKMFISQDDIIHAQQAHLAYLQNRRSNPTLTTFSLENELFQAFENYKNENPLQDSICIKNNSTIYH